MRYSKKVNIQSAVILMLFSCFFAGVMILTYYPPAKFFSSPNHEVVSLVRDDWEFGVYYDRVSFIRNGGWPYADRLEYPPLAVLYLSIPAFFGGSFEVYQAGLIGLNCLTALFLVFVTYKLLNVMGKKPSWLWLMAAPSFVYFIMNRFDVWPALLVQISLWMLIKKKFPLAFFVLSLAFLAKGYAVVLFPIFFLYYLNNRGIQSPRLFINRPLLLMVIPWLILTGVFCVVVGLENSLFPYIFQSTRFFSYGAWPTIFYNAALSFVPLRLLNIITPMFLKIFLLLQIVIPILFYAGYRIFRRYLKTAEDVIRWSLLALLLFIQFSVYYSPQWFVWLLPLLLLSVKDKKDIMLIIAYDVVNYIQYPTIWQWLGPDSPAMMIVALVRTILLVVITVKVWQGMAKPPSFKESYSSAAVLLRK